VGYSKDGRELSAEFIRIALHQPEMSLMRTHHIIAVIAVLVVAIGAKQFFFPPVNAEADVNSGGCMNVLQMQHDINPELLPEQEMRDMSVVFSEPN